MMERPMRREPEHMPMRRPAAPPEIALGFAVGDTAAADQRQTFTIRDLTREFGVTSRTLRFYEERGLLTPEREGQERVYSRRDWVRLRLAVMGKSVGFSLEEIRAMLDLYDLGDGQETQLKVAHARFLEQIERLQRQRSDIDRAIAELERASRCVMDRLAARGA
jgi:DNA-binding transcriptional MerR regulator